ncbi:MAG: hypothetical protein JOZ18_16060 [Chloroflexi bacterium]|nr:hypothetical protein [Chloroflexota bacterium]
MDMKHQWQKIPKRISALAESYDLGTPIIVYKRLLHVVIMYVLIAFLLVSTLFSVLYVRTAVVYVHTALGDLTLLQFMNVIFRGQVDHELKVGLTLQQLFLIQQMPLEMAVNVLRMLACATSFFAFYLLQKQRLYICSEGLLVYLGPFGKKYRAVRWDEIKEISAGNTLRLTDGSKFALTLPFSSSMKKEIYQTITRHVVPPSLSEQK